MTTISPLGESSQPSPSGSSSQKRGKTGCITCRLRKKRCDEEKPYCATCSRLGIECMGYGAKRPGWMRGDDNKRKAREDISKAIQAQTKRKSSSSERRTSSLWTTPNTSPESLNLGPGLESIKHRHDWHASPDMNTASSVLYGSWARSLEDYTPRNIWSQSEIASGYRASTLQTPLGRSAPETHPVAIPNTMFYDSSRESNGNANRTAGPRGWTAFYDEEAGLSMHSEWTGAQAVQDSFGGMPSYSYTAEPGLQVQPIIGTRPSHYTMNTHTHTHPRPETHFLTLYSPLQLDSQSSALSHTSYLHHYLKVVLPLQYRLASNTLIDFIGQLALTQNGVMTAAASLAALHLSSQRKGSSAAFGLSFPDHGQLWQSPWINEGHCAPTMDHDAAVAKQTHQESIQRIRNIAHQTLNSEETIVTTMFAASYHLFSGGTNPGWGYLVDVNQNCLGNALASSPEIVGGPTLYTDPSPWTRFQPLISVMIWMDIIGSVTRNKGSKLLSTYRSLFSPTMGKIASQVSADLAMDKVMGCDNTTLLAYAEITHLPEWRERSEAANTLSIYELVRRAQAIEWLLAQSPSMSDGICQVSSSLWTPTSSAFTTHDKESDDPSINAMRGVFHAGAKVYLASVVNGPYPREISSAVQQTIQALSQLDLTTPNPDINRALVLPITLTGCLAHSPAEQQFFRNRFTRLGPEAASFGNSKQALVLMEEVWKQRAEMNGNPAEVVAVASSGFELGDGERRTGKVCWRQVMKSLGWDEGIFLI